MTAATAMFDRYVVPDRAVRVAPHELENYTRDEDGKRVLSHVGVMADRLGYLRTYADREQAEGPRWRVEVSPGSVKVTRRDPVRWDRRIAAASERSKKAARRKLIEDEIHHGCGGANGDACMRRGCDYCRKAFWSEVPGNASGKVRTWSARSRNAMRYRLATLDYSGLFVDAAGNDTAPAMVTLTYPGDWQAVAPSNAAVQRHLRALRLRWNRAWGCWLDGDGKVRENLFFGVWKREFQRRGAPHYHLLIVPPDSPHFRSWLSQTWAEIVGAEWCGSECWTGAACCERGRHVQAGTGVDFREGARATDPRRLAVYFAKHGAYGAKEYQNEGPQEWLENGGLGRFWGVWGVPPVVSAVEVDPAVAQAVARTLRRLMRSQRYAMSLRLLRCTKGWDRTTGEEVAHAHTTSCYRWNTIVVRRFRGSLGHVVVNNGPALAVALARASAVMVEREGERPTRRLSGPVGFLP